MNSLIRILLILIFFTSMAMQCNNRLLIAARQMDIQVIPEEIPIVGEEVSFQIITKLPPTKSFRDIDSLVYEISYQNEDIYHIIGGSKIYKHVGRNHHTILSDSSIFNFANFSRPDNPNLYYRLILYKKGFGKASELLPIGRFKNE